MANLIFMNKQFEILKANRVLILKIIENLSLEQLNKIPNGFKNNIVWNLAHLTVTQQLLCYEKSGLSTLVSTDMITSYKKGTAPGKDVSKEEFEHLKVEFLQLPNKFAEDFRSNVFTTYNSYTTSANVTLNNIQDALEFNNFHEGIHLGAIMSLKKLV